MLLAVPPPAHKYLERLAESVLASGWNQTLRRFMLICEPSQANLRRQDAKRRPSTRSGSARGKNIGICALQTLAEMPTALFGGIRGGHYWYDQAGVRFQMDFRFPQTPTEAPSGNCLSHVFSFSGNAIDGSADLGLWGWHFRRAIPPSSRIMSPVKCFDCCRQQVA